MDIFISCAIADQERVRVLVEAMEKEGFFGRVTSKGRRWVRLEADLADKLGRSMPLQFDRVVE